MGGLTKIQWTDAVWNPVTGCTKVSAGCKNCYAEGIAKRFWGDRKFTDVQLHPERLEQPLHWKKPRMIFVNSMSDLFHEDIPFEFITEIFRVIDGCKRHTFQILTKRPNIAIEYLSDINGGKYSLPDNVWLGVSVEDQVTADERIPLLLQTPAAVRWISAEPLLDRISLQDDKRMYLDSVGADLDWVVVGGESGQRRRPIDLDWARNIRGQCKQARVPFFMKQVDKIKPIPKDLMIREYPNVTNFLLGEGKVKMSKN